MAHYAFLDNNNVVVQIIVGKEENSDGIDWEQFYSNEMGLTCKRTSYNTLGGQHMAGKTPFRKNCAVIGGIYDPVRDAFYIKQPYDSWTLNEDTCIWEPPIARPKDNKDYTWDEELGVWKEVII
jgi:hypothetical protein